MEGEGEKRRKNAALNLQRLEIGYEDIGWGVCSWGLGLDWRSWKGKTSIQELVLVRIKIIPWPGCNGLNQNGSTHTFCKVSLP